MDLEIKGLKYMDGPDSLIFRCSVYVEGKRRFVASDDGNGGCHAYDPIETGATTYADSREWIRQAEAWAKTLPDREIPLGYNDKTITVESDLDQVIDDLVFAEMDRRWLKAQCRNKTLFRAPGDDPADGWRTIDHKFNDDVRLYVLARYPGAEIANEAV